MAEWTAGLRPLRFFFHGRRDAAHAEGVHEILVAEFPRHAQGIQDVTLGRLSAGAPFFDGVNGARRNVGLPRELVLGPSKGLSGSANAVHVGRLGLRGPLLKSPFRIALGGRPGAWDSP